MLVQDNPLEKWIEEQGYYVRDSSGLKGRGISYFQKSYSLIEEGTERVIRSFSGDYNKVIERLYSCLKNRLLRQQDHRFHARRRCKQRFGCKLSINQYERLCNQIRSQRDAYFLRRKELGKSKSRRTIWAVKFKDMWLPVVYDKRLQTIVTVLPRHKLESYMTGTRNVP